LILILIEELRRVPPHPGPLPRGEGEVDPALD
jgi:hypothetical protein